MKHFTKLALSSLVLLSILWACNQTDVQRMVPDPADRVASTHQLSTKTASSNAEIYLDRETPFAFVTSVSEGNNLKVFDRAVLDLPEIKEGLAMVDFYDAAVEKAGYSLDEPYTLVAINFYGYLLGLELPNAYIQTLDGHQNFQKTTCNCTEPGVCWKELFRGTYARLKDCYRILNCSAKACQLKTVSDDPPGNV